MLECNSSPTGLSEFINSKEKMSSLKTCSGNEIRLIKVIISDVSDDYTIDNEEFSIIHG